MDPQHAEEAQQAARRSQASVTAETAHARTQAAILDEWVGRYADEPELYVREVFGVEPDPWQAKFLAAYRRAILPGATAKDKRISIRSGHGPGKTAALAWVCDHFLTFRFPQKTAITAPTEGQLYDALFSEIKIWHGRKPPQLSDPKTGLFDIKSDRIELRASPAESFLTAKTARPEKPEALAGVHSDWVLLIADEASGVPEPIFEAASGSMSAHNSITILAGNPVRSTGLFYDTHNKLSDRWTTFHVSCYDSPRISRDFIEDMKARYGEESNAFRVRVLGEFPRGDEDTVIPREWIEAAMARDVKEREDTPVVWGFDPGWADRAALVKRKGRIVTERPKWKRGYEEMQLVGWIKTEYEATPASQRPVEILVDAIGMGGGIASRMRELKLPARSINVSESPAVKGQYPNLRTELWFEMKAWFQARDCQIPNRLPGHDELMEDFVEELAAQTHEPPTSAGKIACTAKKKVKSKLGRSPDLADALMLTFASNAGKLMFGTLGRSGEPLRRNIKGIV